MISNINNGRITFAGLATVNKTGRNLMLNSEDKKIRLTFSGTSFNQPAKNDGKDEIRQMLKMQQEAMSKFFEEANATTATGQSKSTAVAGIFAKLMAGQELSPSELEYLKEADPELYEKAVKVANERKEYERKLKQCKSKDEVEKVKLEKLSNLSSEMVPASAPNSYETNTFVTMRTNAVMDEHTKFVNSERYRKLPQYAKNAPINKEQQEKETEEEKKTKIDAYV